MIYYHNMVVAGSYYVYVYATVCSSTRFDISQI